MRSHPTAGQTTLEYLAAVALLAALFLFAGPAVGAPDIARSVAKAIEHGLCVVGGDVCTTADAQRAGLAPCPLRSDLEGHEGAVSALVFELGGKSTMTVTPQSDGTVAVMRTASASAGLIGAATAGLEAGPVTFEAGAEGTVRARFQGAVGWVFPDQATANSFLAHSLEHAVDPQRWPPAWWSGEAAGEATATGKLGAQAEDHGIDAGGGSASGSIGIGYRRFRDGSTTTYTREAIEGPEASVSFLPSPFDLGKAQWIAEYTRGPHGEPRELVLRTATSAPLGKRVTEVAARLDLTDPDNYRYVGAAISGFGIPRASPLGSIRRPILDWIATHGTIETMVSEVDDASRGGSLAVKLGVKIGLSGKQLVVHKTLVSATVQRGALVGKRLDCLPAKDE